MDQFLAEYYGTADVNDIEKTAAAQRLEWLFEKAAQENVDLSGLSEDELLAIADEVEAGDYGVEKEAAEKFEEADYLGRVMAHSFTHELRSIEKEASVKGWLRGVGGRIRQGERELSERVGDRLLRPGSRRLAAAEERAARSVPVGGRGYIGHRKLEMAQAKRRAGRQAAGAAAGGATALGAGGGVGYALNERNKKSADAEINEMIIQRANEHLEAAGLLDKTAGAEDFETQVDRAALELLEANGYPVEWY